MASSPCVCARARKYRIWLGPGYRTAAIIVDTTSGKDHDLGDLSLERCPSEASTPPKTQRPQTGPAADLMLEQIVIDFPVSLNKDALPEDFQTTSDRRSNKVADPPPCWLGMWSLGEKAQWGNLCTVQFREPVSLQSFIGDKVKSIRVVRTAAYPKLTLTQIRERLFSIESRCDPRRQLSSGAL